MNFSLERDLLSFPASWRHANAYYLGLGGGVLIDPGLPRPADFDRPVARLIATHAHYDHIAGVESWREGQDPQPRWLLPEDDVWMLTDTTANASRFFNRETVFPAPDATLHDGELISLDEHYTLEVLATPGHSKGSICLILWEAKGEGREACLLFSGDTFFAESIGRYDFGGGSGEDMLASIRRMKPILEKLPGDLPVFPGHSRVTTVSGLLTENRYIREESIL